MWNHPNTSIYKVSGKHLKKHRAMLDYSRPHIRLLIMVIFELLLYANKGIPAITSNLQDFAT